MNKERGQVLPLVLVAIAVGTLLISPFLTQASASLISSRDYGLLMANQHSAEAGIEHAIWDLTYDDLASEFSTPGDSFSYQLSEAVNGTKPTITVIMTGTPNYSISSSALGTTITTGVNITSQTVSIISWQVE
ncbi:MAG: hypothetical protein SVM79_04760 [Chloroflexota bacterium]|nr:hypothetical protein [Chloroflexota bacterium]